MKRHDLKTFAKRGLPDVLDYLLEQYDITVPELARRTGVRRTTINDWLYTPTGKHFTNYRKIAAYFRVPLFYLLFGELEKTDCECDGNPSSAGDPTDPVR